LYGKRTGAGFGFTTGKREKNFFLPTPTSRGKGEENPCLRPFFFSPLFDERGGGKKRNLVDSHPREKRSRLYVQKPFGRGSSFLKKIFPPLQREMRGKKKEGGEAPALGSRRVTTCRIVSAYSSFFETWTHDLSEQEKKGGEKKKIPFDTISEPVGIQRNVPSPQKRRGGKKKKKEFVRPPRSNRWFWPKGKGGEEVNMNSRPNFQNKHPRQSKFGEGGGKPLHDQREEKKGGKGVQGRNSLPGNCGSCLREGGKKAPTRRRSFSPTHPPLLAQTEKGGGGKKRNRKKPAPTAKSAGRTEVCGTKKGKRRKCRDDDKPRLIVSLNTKKEGPPGTFHFHFRKRTWGRKKRRASSLAAPLLLARKNSGRQPSWGGKKKKLRFPEKAPKRCGFPNHELNAPKRKGGERNPPG